MLNIMAWEEHYKGIKAKAKKWGRKMKTEEEKAETRRVYLETHKEQRKEYWQQYYARNRDKLIEKNKKYSKVWREKNPKMYKELGKKNYERVKNNRVRIDGHTIEFREKRWVRNKEERITKRREIKKEHMKEYYLWHKEKIYEANKKYKEIHPEKAREAARRYFISHREDINEARRIRYANRTKEQIETDRRKAIELKIKKEYQSRMDELNRKKLWEWLKWWGKISSYKFPQRKKLGND